MIIHPKRESAYMEQLSHFDDEPPDILKSVTGQAGMPGTGPVTASTGGSPGFPDPARSHRFTGMESTPGNGTYSSARIR